MIAPPPLQGDEALFIDFDGTLTWLQANPAEVWLADGLGDVLLGLSGRLGGALCILSGRDTRDLCRRVPDQLWRAGLHGMEVVAPGESPPATPPAAPDGLEQAIAEVVSHHDIAWLEAKGAAFAVHYRGHAALARPLQDGLVTLLRDWPDHKLQGGHFVWEIKPPAANKGRCLKALMQHPAFAGRRPVMIGDDVTDEDGMQAAMALNGSAIKIGDRDSLAPHRLDDPDAFAQWLADQPPVG